MSFLTREYKLETSSTTAAAKDQRTMAMRSVKKLLRPLLRLVKKKQLLQQKSIAEVKQQNASNASLEDMRKDAARNANDDNIANERLEQRLYAELEQCTAPEAAIIVRQGEQQHLLPVHPQRLQRQQQYIPVHFARTANGTFFWTSMDMSRQQELQLRAQLDRWGQA